MSFKDKIDMTRLPRHIAIIMDGNGRWAQQHGHDRVFGHVHGVDAVRTVTEASAELGVGYLTLYTFSTENWNRPKYEVESLMNLFVETIRKEIEYRRRCQRMLFNIFQEVISIVPVSAHWAVFG